MTNNDSIELSPKHGVNPSILVCATCGKDIGVALIGRMRTKDDDDALAPRFTINGSMCDDCLKYCETGILMVEATESDSKNKHGQAIPIPTGRFVVLRDTVLDDTPEHPCPFEPEMREHLRKTRVLFMRPEHFEREFGQAVQVDEAKNLLVNSNDDTKN